MLTPFRLQHLKNLSPHLDACSSVTRLFHEFLNMTLYIDIDIIIRFAGKCGEEEAHRAYQLLQTWRDTKHGRAATWHAAQVLRAARATRPYELRGAESFLTFHAVMVLWTHSIMYVDSAKHSRSNTPAVGQRTSTDPARTDDSAEHPVFLDEAVCDATEAYIHLGRGRPCMRMRKEVTEDQASREICDLRSPPSVMQVGVQVLRSNCPGDAPQDMPQMLRSLCDVMDGLGRLK